MESRLRTLKWLACGASALALAAVAGSTGTAATATKVGAVATSPSKWRSWYLTSANQFRIKAPAAPKSAKTKAELAQIVRLQKRLTPAQRAAIARWNGQPAVIPWTELALQMVQSYRPRPTYAARVMALFETALYDAMVAASDSELAYAKARPAPAKLDKRIKPLLKDKASCAPMNAAIAGAAETTLRFLFPGERPQTFINAASEAVNSRVWAGVNYRSDVQAARALGQKVGALSIARARTDGSTGTRLPNPVLSGEQYWSSTPPLYEPFIGGPVGTWKTWLLATPSEKRGVLPGPSPYGSPTFMRELKLVLDTSYALNDTQRQIANFWDDGPGTDTPAGHWFRIAIQLAQSYKLSGPQTTRALALLGTVTADSVIASWEAKYYWWSIRPISAIWRLSADRSKLLPEAQCAATPSLCPLRGVWYSIISTPGFPSYPAGHATFSGGAGRILTYFFPRAADTINQLANQAALSRLYGGIHFDEDGRDGLILGRSIADLAIGRAKADGSG